MKMYLNYHIHQNIDIELVQIHPKSVLILKQNTMNLMQSNEIFFIDIYGHKNRKFHVEYDPYQVTHVVRVLSFK